MGLGTIQNTSYKKKKTTKKKTKRKLQVDISHKRKKTLLKYARRL